jgi:hypothetical protein
MPAGPRLLRSAAMALFVIIVATPSGAATQGRNRIHTLMLNTGAARSARGRIVMIENRAQTTFTIRVDGMTPSASYDVLVDGAVRDQISTNAGGHGQVRHQARLRSGRSTPLPYDPKGAKVQIASAGTVVLTADVPETPGECDAQDEIKLDLTPATGVAGSASAEFRELGGRMKFEVRLSDAAPGAYDLIVAGSNVGQIVVGVDGDGEIRFDSAPSASVGDDDDQGSDDPEDAMDLLLTFDPRGQTIELQQAGVAAFSGTLPTTPPAAEGPGDEDGDHQGDGDD